MKFHSQLEMKNFNFSKKKVSKRSLQYNNAIASKEYQYKLQLHLQIVYKLCPMKMQLYVAFNHSNWISVYTHWQVFRDILFFCFFFMKSVTNLYSGHQNPIIYCNSISHVISSFIMPVSRGHIGGTALNQS